MAKRTQFYAVASDEEGNSLEDITVTVYDVGTLNEATIYGQRTGGSTTPSEFDTGEDGVATFWAPSGSYDVVFHDATLPARIDDYTVNFNAVSGDVAGIDGAQIENSGIENLQIANGTIGPEKWAAVPVCILSKAESTASGGSLVTKSWDTADENKDTHSMHDGTTNKSRITLPFAGTYRTVVQFDAGSGMSANDVYGCALLYNGVNIVSDIKAISAYTNFAKVVVEFMAYLPSGYFEAQFFQAHGSAVTFTKRFATYWLGP